MTGKRPSVLVLAGFDQSGGAGILADVKTFESHGVDAYAVCTGLTFQNEHEIRKIRWMPASDIREQLDVCFAARSFDWVKIGITSSTGMLQDILDQLRQHHPSIRVVLDPVIRSTGGTAFWETMDPAAFEAIARQVYLVTPNRPEIQWLYPGTAVMEACERLSAYCNLYLKGGHDPGHPGTDWLWHKGRRQVLPPGTPHVFAKHGSGCVLASSLTAHLVLGNSLTAAAEKAKAYTEQFLNSNNSLLGWHAPLKNT